MSTWSTPPSRLDLTGQASEDEPASPPSRGQLEMPPAPSSGANETKERAPQSRPRDDSDDGERTASRALTGSASSAEGALRRLPELPNPIDLWRDRTIPSLLLLPFVLAVYVFLQLPLQLGSSSNGETWKGRAKDVDKLSEDLNAVETDLKEVKEDHLEIRGEVATLRRRLNRMKERRREREETGRVQREEQRRREEEEIKELWERQQQVQKAREQEKEWQEEQERLNQMGLLDREEQLKLEKLKQERLKQQGMGEEGPIASAELVEAADVATFAGGRQSPSAWDAKKAD